ncbi:hypothetical protein FACS1894159_00080 [Bacteroidia bacterium]|nr:hypothetical protein FACS1894159_00080 [Bacteroidia bacterium]
MPGMFRRYAAMKIERVFKKREAGPPLAGKKTPAFLLRASAISGKPDGSRLVVDCEEA